MINIQIGDRDGMPGGYSNLSSMATVGLDVPKLKKYLDLRKELLTKNESYNELRKEIFKSYEIDVMQTDANEKFNSHIQRQEIQNKIMALDNEAVVIEHGNFLSEEEVLRCGLGKTGNEIDLLMDLLKIKDKTNG